MPLSNAQQRLVDTQVEAAVITNRIAIRHAGPTIPLNLDLAAIERYMSDGASALEKTAWIVGERACSLCTELHPHAPLWCPTPPPTKQLLRPFHGLVAVIAPLRRVVCGLVRQPQFICELLDLCGRERRQRLSVIVPAESIKIRDDEL